MYYNLVGGINKVLKKNKVETFRPDEEVRKILEKVTVKGVKKSEFIKEAIKYYYHNKGASKGENNISLEVIDGKLEKILNKLENTKSIECNDVKLSEDIVEDNKDMTEEEMDNLILDIGNAFIAWGENSNEDTNSN